MHPSLLPALIGAAAIGFASMAWADDPRVPQTGSQQGETVPHALPGQDIHHPGGPPQLTAPTGLTPQTGSEQSVETPNSLPGSTRPTGEAQPHNDIVSSPGAVPRTGSIQGQHLPGSR